MEYKLNKTPLNTTNSFKINDFKVDLELDNNYNFKDYIVNTNNITFNEVNNFNSKIGLSFTKAKEVNINIKDNIDDIILEYDFTNNDTLIDIININYEENSNSNIIIKYKSLDNNKHFHHLKLVVNAKSNSKGSITIVNMLNNNSNSFIAIENNCLDNSEITNNIIDISSNIKINNIYSEVYLNAKNYVNNIYLGKDNNLIDLNYHLKNIGKNSTTNIEVEGLLNDYARKHFKGTIDFISGCSNSIGKENENCVLLSNHAISRSLPMLLCGEENVDGAHSVSTGKIDSNKLFYLESRGFSIEEATKLIVKSNFNKIINLLPEVIKDEINSQIEDNIM